MEKLSQQIQDFGYAVQMIPASDYFPSFAYTIGLWKNYKHPEIIAFGLNIDTLHAILNNVGEAVKSGKVFYTETPYNDVLKDFPVQFLQVDKRNYADYFGQAMAYYTADFTALELLWTDKNKKFPFEADFDEMLKFFQPLLDRNADFKFFEEKNLGVFTTSDWLERKETIVEVHHDTDGDWFFLTQNYNADELKLVALEQIILSDNSLNAIFDLEYGEKATRNDLKSPWKRER